MKRLILLASLAAILVSSCNLNHYFSSPIAKSWKFLNMKQPGVNYYDDTNSMLIDTINNRFKMAYLRFYDDQNYTMIGDNVSSLGTWHFEQADSTLVLDNFYHRQPVTFKLERQITEFLKIHLIKIGKTNVNAEGNTLSFEGDPHFEHFRVDLMSHEANAWRIRPDHKESHSEIKKRLMAHLDYVIAYFQLVHDEERTYFEPVYFQTILRFYQNGIGLEHQDYISNHWLRCFYDHDDALDAYKLMEQALEGMGSYPDAENYTDGYLKATKKMKEALEKLN